MKVLYNETLDWMDQQILIFFSQVPNPRPIPKQNSFALRFVEQTIEQAIIQKLVRIVSGLRASNLLLETGFIQEQAALSRIVNELQDDVCFLAIASLQQTAPKILTQYLEAFYAEEKTIEQWRAKERVVGRNQVPRRKILKFIADHSGPQQGDLNSDSAIVVGHAFSGYVHGASPHIMEMFDHVNNCFRTDAWPENPFRRGQEQDIWNYYHRGIIAFALATKAFGHDGTMEHAMAYLDYFERKSTRR
ncbi:hypothetical protein [Pseudorhodobacter wandonensis]|uniref:hypothetical protein n=1 Tax=Pseudorhodobacter wandonensis TaxID=1120568 RepID=UPI00067B33B5|nr:hypothetical protein [Pseudorhodobacter wandonensis]